MRIVEYYSHLNGLEHILVHKPGLWREITDVVTAVNAPACKTKVCMEKGRKYGQLLYDPDCMNGAFKRELVQRGWRESRTSYWVTSDHKLVRKTLNLTPDEQKQAILNAGLSPIYSYNQTDFVKDRIEIEAQFGKYFSVAYDLFVEHMAFFIGDVIDVGVEIMPMKELRIEMSSGPPYYEGELYNLLRQGRNTPAVPLVLVGIAP
jgi:hypothetical protein